MGVKSTISVSNSKRPINMAKDSNHLAATGRLAKLPAGPTISPNPGPTLVSAVAAAVRLVIRSSPISASSKVTTASVTKNKKEKATAERMMSSCTGR